MNSGNVVCSFEDSEMDSQVVVVVKFPQTKHAFPHQLAISKPLIIFNDTDYRAMPNKTKRIQTFISNYMLLYMNCTTCFRFNPLLFVSICCCFFITEISSLHETDMWYFVCEHQVRLCECHFLSFKITLTGLRRTHTNGGNLVETEKILLLFQRLLSRR